MKIVEKPSLPKEVFQAEAAPQLLAQAVRVYLSNQRQGTQNAKTRAEINRTRHKLYKQKGTGGARHGDRKAPIFVGGGITFAPKPRDYSLSLSKEARKKALFGSLTSKAKEKSLFVVSAMAKMTGKTKELAKFLKDQLEDAVSTAREKSTKGGSVSGKKKEKGTKNWLIVTDMIRENIYRAGRNISGITILPAAQLNTYQILQADKILMMEEAIDSLSNQSKSKEKTTEKPKPTIKVAAKVRAVKATQKARVIKAKNKRSSKKS